MLLAVAGCKKSETNPASEAPSQPTVTETGNSDTVHIERASRFPLVPASSQPVLSTLQVTGSVNPDVSREIPVLSLANGRVVALHVGLGDYVHKGQLVMEVQSPDVTTAFDAYLKAVSDEHLTQVTLTRDKLLYRQGRDSTDATGRRAGRRGRREGRPHRHRAATAHLRRGPQPSRRHGAYLRAGERRDHHAERHQRRRCGHHLRGRDGLADHRRPVACVGDLRCLRERSSQRETRVSTRTLR